MTDVYANGIRLNVCLLGGDRDAADDVAGERERRPVVVFLHGLIMDNLSSYYYTIAPGIAAESEVVLYDLRGHGRSERPAEGYAIADAVDDLVALLDALGHDQPVVLVGNSFGGTVAMAASMRRPERVAAMALIEGHPVVDGWGDETIGRIEGIVEGFDDPGVRDWIRTEGGRKLRKMANTCEQLISNSSLPEDFRAERPTTADDLATIRCPTLLLYGEHSDIIERANFLEQNIPGAELRVLEGCSHSVLMEAPEELEDHILDWLRDPATLGALVAVGTD